MKNLSRFTDSGYVRSFSMWEGNFINNSDVGYPEEEDTDELPSVNYSKTKKVSEEVED